MSYKEYNWEVVANDYNSPFFRNYIWVRGLYYYPELNNTQRLVCGIVSKDDIIEYVTDLESWKKLHEELKERAFKDEHFVEDLINQSHQEGEKFNKWTEENILKADLKDKSGKELYKLLEKFRDWQGRMYALGTALPVLDFQDFAFVEGFLNQYLKEKLDEKEFKDYYIAFTEPPANSFAQDQEEDLLNIISEHWDYKNWRKDVETKTLEELKKLYPKFYKDLIRHTEKHCWVYYVYNGPESTVEDFLDFAKDYIIKLEHPEKLLKEIAQKREKIAKQKAEFIKKYKPSDFEKKMLDLAGKFVWGKPRRKDYQSKSYYHVKKLQVEIAKRLNLSLAQMRSTPFDMIYEGLVERKELDTKIINSIKKFSIILPNDNGELTIMYGKEAEDFYPTIKKIKEEKYKGIDKVEGTTACPGKVIGVVKVINIAADMHKMERGNVLVSVNTTPNIVAAMKKASAIVTDEGGLTCHAAIVSREMNTPCIIGTKFATKIFKDGDKVEVDAEQGIVRKL